MSFPPPDMRTLVASQQANLTYAPIPDYPSDLEWVTAYLVQRMLSHASWAYAYLVWIIIGLVYLIYSFTRWTGLNNSYLAAVWHTWALRRRTWRKKHTLALALRKGYEHRQPLSLPPNAHLLAVALLWIGAILISFIGPDSMAPGSFFWNVKDFPTLHARGFNAANYYYLQPKFTITKMWYTSSNRTGLIAFALFPLTVLFALKAPPFAIFAIPQFTHICFDKLAFMHRWCAFLVWLLTTLHVILWCVQLAIDHKSGHNGFHFAWLYTKFRYAWTAYILFTILMVSSLPVVRRRRYETFYALHVLLVPLTLIFSALHHPPVWWWCWAALALWVGERSYRLVWWLNTNGYLGGVRTTNYRSNQARMRSRTIQQQPQPQLSPETPDVLHMHALGQAKGLNHLPVLPQVDESLVSHIHHSLSITGSSYTPPPGFIHAELLAGKTLRIRMVTPGFVGWAPGQHFLLNIPFISKYTSHPFTVASVCDSKAVSAAGHELIFYVRAKKGWTKRLWNAVVELHHQGLKYPSGDGRLPPFCPLPPRGVLLRAFVDGPFGSAGHARWNDHSTVLLVAGGSGVSFALSVLEYMCMCMAGRDGRELGGQPGGLRHRNFKTQRVRFVWLVREFGHIHWCASFLRRCVKMVGSSADLQVDIFVTNYTPSLTTLVPTPQIGSPRLDTISESPLAPPSPGFVRDAAYSPYSPKTEKGHVQSPSIASVESDEEDATSDVDLSYYTSEIIEEERGELGHEEHALDFTNFEGDDDSALPGEAILNDAVKMEGRVRRSIWKTASIAVSAKHESYASNNVPFRSTGPIHERPASAAMMSLHPLAEATLSRVQLTAPLNVVASPKIGGRPHSEIEKATLTPIVTAVPVNPRRGSQSCTPPESPRPLSALSEFSGDAHSLAALVSEAAARDQIVLELDEEELNDISVVSGHTRAGRPALNKILADEVERAQGSIIVGCCGPTSLSAVVRKHIAAQINPSRVLHGDMRGQIDLVSEDFEY